MYGQEKLTKEYILSRISEQEIMERYLGIRVVYNNYFTSPLRSDKTPTCCFYIDRRGVLVLRDYAGHFHGDCFNVVEKLYGDSFPEALRRIAADFNLRGTPVVSERVTYLSSPPVSNEPRRISIKRQAWTNRDVLYWSSYGIKSSTLLKYDVSSISHAWLDDKMFYVYKEDDIGYAYRLGKGEYKIYFPLRKEYRFVSNTSVIQGYQQLPRKSGFLIITKSLKDVMLLSQYDIPAIAPSAEGTNLDPELVRELKSRFTHVFTLYDFDYAGIKGALKIRRKYGIQPLFLTNGRFNSVQYHAKDLSDFYKRYGEEALSSLLHQSISWHNQSESSQLV